MADGVEFSLDGFDDVIKRLGAFTDQKSMRRITTRATRAGLRETRKKARASYAKIDRSNTKENISRNITVKINSKSFNRNGIITGRVGVIGGAKKDGDAGGPGGDTWYWRFIEFGFDHNIDKNIAKHRKHRKNPNVAKGTTRKEGRKLLTKAMNEEEMTIGFKNALSASIDKEIKKYGAPR